ncbi:hypothetical protein C5C07_15360 [Haloferax sp. Atlit-4N]|uniref:hypothetical protein n=1 Tax=Haloferax sp. Atlit-4N TaxID=2077206 RepID=UPI000E278C22|nr:hypothetical protein [Haloferax sp. Atlit-4N]RDZ53111.1 hypothetical protein C5C07_15360 [Haloferax sp. Atlit-4N]
MGIFRFLRQWKEKANGVLTGPTLEADEVTAETATLTDLIASESITIPQYDATANAPQQPGLIEVPPSGSDTAGFYRWDGSAYALLDQSGGVDAGDLSGLTVDTDKDWGGYELTNVGKDGVKVPSSVDLTVEDWEEGTLSDAWGGAASKATVQSSTVLNGTHDLQLDTDGNIQQIVSLGGLESYIEKGDTFSTEFQLTDTGDFFRIVILAQEMSSGNAPNGCYFIDFRAGPNDVNLNYKDKSGNVQDLDTQPVPLSSNLNTPIAVNGYISKSGELHVEASINGTTEAVAEGTQQSPFDSGGVGFALNNDGSSSTAFVSDVTVTRRTRDYLTDTEKGPVELGGEVVRPKGALDAGPHEAVVSDRTVHGHLRTDDAVSPGDDISLVEWDAGVGQRRLAAQADGEGGLYALRRPRAARLTERLMWEYETLADVPAWSASDGGVSNWTFNVNDRPRRMHVEHDGSGGSDDYGGVGSPVLVSYQSLGPFRFTFRDVTFTDNNQPAWLFLSDRNDLGDGFVRDVGSGFGFEIGFGNDDTKTYVTNSGTPTNGTSVTTYVWGGGTTHDLTVEYDGSEVRFLVDGNMVGPALDFSVNADFSPVLQVKEESTDASAETLEVGEVIVEGQ